MIKEIIKNKVNKPIILHDCTFFNNLMHASIEEAGFFEQVRFAEVNKVGSHHNEDLIRLPDVCKGYMIFSIYNLIHMLDFDGNIPDHLSIIGYNGNKKYFINDIHFYEMNDNFKINKMSYAEFHFHDYKVIK
ncbi:hypothetical protein [Bacillus atrophaeus]|uniref:hypothetical protein n=1 Tax=Bacillus atrophaeus TaxID=1452 RepID=UPI002DFC0ED5|nr:hypothetical protein [Bacillus atrophaeus]